MKSASIVVITVLLAGLPAWAQRAEYRVPKYSSAYKKTTKDSGPRPGSQIPEGASSNATFRRAYISPTALRLLVRAECGESIGRDELIQRGKLTTDPNGPTVQIDWGPIRDSKVVFWAVVSSSKTISTVDLVGRDGKYEVAGKKKSVQEEWFVQKLSVGKKRAACVEEAEMDPKDLSKSVTNLLNRQTLLNRRRALGKTSAGD